MAATDITQAQPIAGLSYADAAAQDAPTGVSPQLDLTNEHSNGTANGFGGAHHRSSLRTNGEKFPEPPTPGEYSGRGLDTTPRSPVRGGHKRLKSKGSKTSLKAHSQGRQKSQGDDDSSLYEKRSSWTGDGSLTSLKTSEDHQEFLRVDKMEHARNKPADLALESGRIPSAGWERSGIRWAPMSVPLKRRLQTLMVLGHSISLFLLISNFFLLAAIPLFWPLLVPYLIYILLSQASTNGKLGQRSEWLRRQKVWSLFASYFPARLHRTEVLPPTRKYIFGYHPHGIISHGAFAAFGTEALGYSQLFPGITNTLLTLDTNFRVPFYRDYLLWLGLASVSKESCVNILSQGGPNNEGMGRAVTIVIGGARESLYTKPGTLRLALNCRKGFVKLAVETGADLVPVLAFGENDIYDQLSSEEHPWLQKIQLVFKRFTGFTTPVFHARGVFNYDIGIMPYRRPMNIVVGRAIKVDQQKTPDCDYVNQIHTEYLKELRLIWETWKDDFAKDRVAELDIVE